MAFNWKHALVLPFLSFWTVSCMEYELASVFQVKGKTKREVSAVPKNNHDEDATFHVTSTNHDWVLDLKKNREHHADTIILRTFDENDKLKQEKHTPESCYYHGKVKGKPGSSAVISTCNGLRGSVEVDDQMYYIEPFDGKKVQHKIIMADEHDPNFSTNLRKHCGSMSADGKIKFAGEQNQPMNKSNKRSRRNLIDVDSRYIPYLTTNKTRYVELSLTADNKLYQVHNNDTKQFLEKILIYVNEVDREYSAINIRIVLVLVEFWTNGDKFVRSDHSGTELGKYGRYWKENLRDVVSQDVSHFLSSHGWKGGVLGLAWQPGACSRNGPTAVNEFFWRYTTGAHGIMAHELGHNLNMPHDGAHCKCLSPNGGCISGGSGCFRCGFSDCDLKGLANRFPCIDNYPKKTFRSKCGNGILEPGEECDCGTPEMCKKKDPCCQPYGCKLRQHFQCSDYTTPECCKHCLFKKQGLLCRESKSGCDVPEYCTGESSICPADDYLRDGTPCGEELQEIEPSSENMRKVNMVLLQPQFVARYIKINPRFGKPGKRFYGIRMEVLGCPTTQALGTVPTSIVTDDLNEQEAYVLSPSHLSCNYSGDSRVAYRRVMPGLHDKREFQFLLGVDGILRHPCSGRMVCPDAYMEYLIVSKNCNADDAKFERTAKFSLRHIKTKKCVIARKSEMAHGALAQLLDKCDERNGKSRLHFQKADCLIPLGMESGDIPDSAITASSYYSWKHLHFKPKEARLWIGSLGWVSKLNSAGKSNEFLQIDLGKELRIGGLKMQAWMKGFVIYYSNDAIHWKGYAHSGSQGKGMNSHCSIGKCTSPVLTQCRNLWGIGATVANNTCWNQLNTEAKGFGTCHPLKNVSCPAEDIFCGQIQCSSRDSKPGIANYGKAYKKIDIGNKQHCSAASITESDEVGLGMVADGTPCGPSKMCHKYKCKNVSEAVTLKCLQVDGKECAGRGVCRNTGVCYCYEGYDPKTGCKTLLKPRDGAFGPWSTWTACNWPCGGGKRNRHRFCDKPASANGGKDCVGPRLEEENCNTEPCPKAESCRRMQLHLKAKGLTPKDGIYTIQTVKNQPMKAYCDMTRDGGGWTLVVASATNKWDPKKVLSNNANKPDLFSDYSMLKYANDLKDYYMIKQDYFEYRLEAERRGAYGGIFQAPSHYSFTSTYLNQTGVKLVKKFGNWQFIRNGLRNRMPYIYGSRLTTTDTPKSNKYGSITGNSSSSIPAAWIGRSNKGWDQNASPNNIWYWMREGTYETPQSCRGILKRGTYAKWNPTGVYNIQSATHGVVSTYCDMDTYGGGWTLLVTKRSKSGWTRDNVVLRNKMKASLVDDYSIFGLAEKIKNRNPYEDSFQYLIEADGRQNDGGIFKASKKVNFFSQNGPSLKPELLEKFGNWLGSDNLAQRVPYVTEKCGHFLTTCSNVDSSGGLITNRSIPLNYLPNVNANPSLVRVWIREGGSRVSCNDIKVHGNHKGMTDFKDGIYFIKSSKTNQLPVYCDMTSNSSAWTLLVTSKENNWTAKQVLSKNKRRPSLHSDYSILELGDEIKSISSGKTFMYKIDAQSRNSFGGIFEAPMAYTFLAKNNKQTKVKLLTKFGAKWGYNRYDSVMNRMPYLGNAKYKAGLLTTSSSERSAWYGTLISGNTQYRPAPYINYHALNPGVIWYWVSEDDCLADRKPVDGGLSQWSLWSQCSGFCTNGTQTRSRKCNSPFRRCGGKECDPKKPLVETRNCAASCLVSGIKSEGDKFCLEPQTRSCNVPDGTSVVRRSGTKACDEKYGKFTFDSDTGTITHKCSGKMVCPIRNKSLRNAKIVISSMCPAMAGSNFFLRTQVGSINYNGYCIWPQGRVRPNQTLVLWNGCFESKVKMDFYEIAHGAVKAEMWTGTKSRSQFKTLTEDARYPNNPSNSGYLDNIDIPYNVGSSYSMRLRTLFLAPETGHYQFMATCDDICQVYLSNSTDAANKATIITITSWQKRYNWNAHSSQHSKSIMLESGKLYYMEGIFIEYGGDDHFSVGVRLPSGKEIKPITKYFLRSIT